MYTDYIQFGKVEDLEQISSIKEEEEIDLESKGELSVPMTKNEGSKS